MLLLYDFLYFFFFMSYIIFLLKHLDNLSLYSRKGNFRLNLEKCSFVDWQRLRVQENADEIPPGTRTTAVISSKFFIFFYFQFVFIIIRFSLYFYFFNIFSIFFQYFFNIFLYFFVFLISFKFFSTQFHFLFTFLILFLFVSLFSRR